MRHEGTQHQIPSSSTCGTYFQDNCTVKLTPRSFSVQIGINIMTRKIILLHCAVLGEERRGFLNRLVPRNLCGVGFGFTNAGAVHEEHAMCGRADSNETCHLAVPARLGQGP